MNTGCIYRIVNFRNGMVYVGQTHNFASRKKSHLSELMHNKHRNTHLQNAYNKYGREAFFFELLEKGVPANDLDAREICWIAHFDSYANGYNQTAGGLGGVKRQVTWNGVIYDSVDAAASALGVSPSTVKYRANQGWIRDTDIPLPNSSLVRGVEWNGIQFRSVVDAARYCGVTEMAMHRRLKLGYSCDADVKDYKKSCTWNGVTYQSIIEAAETLGIQEATLRFRISKGYTCDEELNNRPQQQPMISKTCIWNGIEYPSIAKAAKANGVTQWNMYYRIKRGYSSDSDIK